MVPPRSDVTQLLAEVSSGDQDAVARLAPVVYNELRRLARYHLRRERANHTLQPTALVHEAYLRLVTQKDIEWQSRSHFFGVASQMMRRVLLDYARKRHAAKRGSSDRRVRCEQVEILSEERAVDLIALDDALTRLGAMDPQQTRIIELRFFGGLSIEETAEVLGISPATVKREWSLSRAWLLREIKKDG